MLFCKKQSMKVLSFHYLSVVDRWILKAGAASIRLPAVESDKSFGPVFILASCLPIFSCLSLSLYHPCPGTALFFPGTIQDSDLDVTSDVFREIDMILPGISYDGGRLDQEV